MTLEANAPEIADLPSDNPNPAPASTEPTTSETPAPEGGVSDSGDAAPQPVPMTTREEIAARFKANRAVLEGEPGVPGDFTTPPFVQRQQAEAAAAPAEDEPAAPEPAAPAAPETYKLKVRGNEFTMSREDVLKTAGLSEEEAAGIPMPALIRAAQINAAAEDYLHEARTTHKDARSAARVPEGTPPSHTADPEPEQPQGDQGTPPSDAQLAERIQFGDAVEAASAARELARRALESERKADREARFQDATRQAVTEFQTSNPDLFVEGDPTRAELLYVTSSRLIREDLIRAGFDRAEIEGAITNPAIAAEALTRARQQGINVRHPAEILNAAAQEVRTRLNLTGTGAPQPASTPSRTDMKRALTPQPTAANVPPAVPRQPPAPRSGTSVVLQMRKARGQSV